MTNGKEKGYGVKRAEPFLERFANGTRKTAAKSPEIGYPLLTRMENSALPKNQGKKLYH
jgi:hypothetical protein